MITQTRDPITKLAYFFREKHSQQFDWRTNNCAFFAADWIILRTGIDPVASYRKMSGRALVKWMREHDLAETIVATTREHGWAEMSVAYAQRGDLMQMSQENVPALGVCNGAMTGFPGQSGLVYHPTLNCQRAWRIS